MSDKTLGYFDCTEITQNYFRTDAMGVCIGRCNENIENFKVIPDNIQ